LIDDSIYPQEKSKFHDSFYLKLLSEKLYTFLVKKCPVQVKTDPFKLKDNKITFSIGQQIVKDFDISIAIHPDDFLLQLEYWLKTYFPQYTTIVEKYVEYTEEERNSLILESDSPEIAIKKIAKGKLIHATETMLLSRIILLEDKFKAFVDGVPFIYSTKKIKLRKFLEGFRALHTDNDKKLFFNEYSFKVKSIKEKPFYEIERSSIELMSLINILKKSGQPLSDSYVKGYLKDGSFVVDENGEYYHWHKYVFSISSDYAKQQFLDAIKK
jgi:hypothetical protein